MGHRVIGKYNLEDLVCVASPSGVTAEGRAMGITEENIMQGFGFSGQEPELKHNASELKI